MRRRSDDLRSEGWDKPLHGGGIGDGGNYATGTGRGDGTIAGNYGDGGGNLRGNGYTLSPYLDIYFDNEYNDETP